MSIDIKSLRKVLDNVDHETVDPQKLTELQALLEQYETSSKNFKILDVVLSPKQQEMEDAIHDRWKGISTKKYFLYWGWNDGWKCHQFNDLILTYTWEYKKAWEIKAWDLLMWPDSKPRKVEATSTGEWQLYKVSTDSWKDIHINKDHILVLVDRRRLTKWRRCEKRTYLDRKVNQVFEPTGKIVEMTLWEYMKLWKRRRHEMYLWSPTNIDFPKSDEPLKIDPYFLGVWLGDWHSNNSGITNIDPEIIKEIYYQADKYNLQVRKNNISYFIHWNHRYDSYLLQDLQHYNLQYNKHIPHSYKTSSREDRLSVLAGLIDTDWSLNEWKWYEITQKNETIIDDIVFIWKSLWFRVSKHKVMKSCTNWKDTSKKPYFRAYISGAIWDIPVRVERKKCESYIRSVSSRVSKIKSITEYSVEKWYWFTLDGDHRYLDENFNVQHNTFWGAYITAKLAIWAEKCKELWMRPIGTKKDIIIGSEDSWVLKNLRNYLIWEDSATRIPPDLIETVKEPWDFIKEIVMKNWARIRFITYKSWHESWQWHNPDWLYMDEEPKNELVFQEAYARSRKPKCWMMMTMTPTGHSQLVSDMFMENDNVQWMEEFVWTKQVYWYLDNPHSASDHIWGMSKEEIKRRVEWSFVPPEGIVFHQFRKEHVINHVDPFRAKEIGFDADYYIGIDPWANHWFWVSFLCRTTSYNPIIPDVWYLFDELLFHSQPLPVIIEEIQKKISMLGKPPKHIIIDSAMRQVALDLKHAGIKCIPSDKRSLWNNKESNRTAWIDLINSLFYQGRFFFSDKCKNSIGQFKKHQYKPWETDWAVVKKGEDLCDSIRYVISFVELFEKKKKFKQWQLMRWAYWESYTQGY